MGVRVRVAVVLAVSSVAAACGSSTSPSHHTSACTTFPTDTATGLTTAQLALHLDSLQHMAANCAQPDRYRLLAYPIAALAENVTPASITLTVNGTAQTYSAVGLSIVGQTAGTTPTVSDSFFVFVAWSDNNATQLLAYQALVPDTTIQVENLNIASDNSQITNSGTLTVGSVSNGGSCGTPVTLTFPPTNSLLDGTTCTQAVWNFQFSQGFTPTSTNPNTSYAANVTALPTARIVLPSTGGQSLIPPRHLVTR